MMGRKRKDRHDLPQRVYFKHGAYHFVDNKNKWNRLGKTYAKAMAKYGHINSIDLPNNMGGIIDTWEREIGSKMPTAENIAYQLRYLRAGFSHMCPDEIIPKDIYAYMAERPKIAANRERTTLSSIFMYAIKRGLASDNPCRLVKKNKEMARDRHVEDWERRVVYELASPGMQGAMDIVREIGSRRGNVIGIRLADLKDDGIHMNVSKGGGKVIFEWTPELRAAVDRIKAIHHSVRAIGPLLCNQSGQPYTKSGFYSEWRRLVKRAVRTGKLKEPFWFHDLRAKTASEPENPSELLVHSDPRVTKQHYDRAPKRIKKIPKILDK